MGRDSWPATPSLIHCKLGGHHDSSCSVFLNPADQDSGLVLRQKRLARVERDLLVWVSQGAVGADGSMVLAGIVSLRLARIQVNLSPSLT